MNDQPSTPSEAGKQNASPESIRKETMSPAAEQIDSFGSLNATQTGMNRWTVTNRSAGTAYQVRIGGENGIACDCPDHQYNRDSDDFETCKHVLYVGFQAPRSMDSDVWSIQQLGSLAADVRDAAHDAKAAAEGMDEALVRSRELSAESVSDDAQTDTQDRPTKEDLAPEPSVDPADAAEQLQDAYDDVIADMQVQHSEGLVWVQTGRDTPETLPGPGNVEVFEAFLQKPEQVTYVHDDHELVSDKPGEWWKNAIAPTAVEEYINEVLE